MTRLETIIVEEPSGHADTSSDFGDFAGGRIGEIWLANPTGNDAPILIKLLFTSERVSRQAHSDDETTRRGSSARQERMLGDPLHLGTKLGLGLTTETTREALRAAAWTAASSSRSTGVP